MERNFHISACVKYDRYVVDQVLAGHSKFGEVDQVAAGLLEGQLRTGNHRGRTFRGQTVNTGLIIIGRHPYQTIHQVKRVLQCMSVIGTMYHYTCLHWTSEICFNFNSKTCSGRCVKLHICSHCKLRHRLADCKFALRDGHSSYQTAPYTGQTYGQYQQRAWGGFARPFNCQQLKPRTPGDNSSNVNIHEGTSYTVGRHFIGGLPSQLKLTAWERELKDEMDISLRQFIYQGV